MERTSLSHKPVDIATLLLRIAIALALLSAVADRFGLWGPPGKQGVSWGDLAHFDAYVAKLNWFLPAAVIPAVGWAATVAETLLALGLLIGWHLRWVSLGSALLLLSFAVAMLVGLGPKAPLDYSVFTSACAAFHFSQSKQHAKTPNQPMKPTAPDQVNVSNLATNPARGLSLCRSAKRCLGVLA
ncbi:MAG: DoxX family protein [Chthoniobacterales bacterium]